MCINLITVGDACHHLRIYVASSLPLHCSNPTYNTLLFLQTNEFYYIKKQMRCIGIIPSSCTLHQTNPTITPLHTRQALHSMCPTPDKRCTRCAKHLTNYTHCALHLTNTAFAVPNLKKKKTKNTCCALHLTNTALYVPCTWRTLLAALHLTNTTLTVPYTQRTYYTCGCSSTVPVHDLQLEQWQTLATRWYKSKLP